MAHGGESIWIATTPETSYPQLSAEVSVDVAVVGAGITGVTAAVLLKRAGKTVALLDWNRIARGATGYTTAKVTSGHGVVYGQLTDTFGEQGARVYAESNQSAIERIAELAQAGRIDCDFERKAQLRGGREGRGARTARAGGRGDAEARPAGLVRDGDAAAVRGCAAPSSSTTRRSSTRASTCSASRRRFRATAATSSRTRASRT